MSVFPSPQLGANHAGITDTFFLVTVYENSGYLICVSSSEMELTVFPTQLSHELLRWG
jgi:hypothetical protein